MPAIHPWRPALAVGTRIGPCAQTTRALHKGHVGRVLEKLDLPRHYWLKEVAHAPKLSEIRRHKDKYLREIGVVHQNLSGLLRDDPTARQAIEPSSEKEIREDAESKQHKEQVNEALRMYRLLRPDAPPFFEEDAMLNMQAKMNRVLAGDADAIKPQGAQYVDHQAFLPVVNHRAFLIALESIVASLADDVETLCLLVGLNQAHLPNSNDPLRFKKLVDILFSVSFPLRKDPSRVHEFMAESWPRLKNLLPEAAARLDDAEVGDWLRGHLRRVKLNQSRLPPKILLHAGQKRFGDEEWYSFAEDFPYDDDPMPGQLADERNLDFPLEQAGDFMRAFVDFLGQSALGAEVAELQRVSDAGARPTQVAEQFQDFVWDLERIGLRNWLRMDVADLERFLPKGPVGAVDVTNEDDLEVAKLMLRCAAKDRSNLLDFEAVDPYTLLHELPARRIDEELHKLPPHPVLANDELEALVDNLRACYADPPSSMPGTDKAWTQEGASVEAIFRKELDFYRTAGPAEWLQDKDGMYNWRWRTPSGAYWDKRRNMYVPEQKGVDPTLELKEMRQHLLEITRMGTMVSAGRVFYFRAIVLIGNGRGVYGFGVGFGNTPKECRADAALKALQNLDYIDYDSGKMLCTPLKGKEYQHACQIIPRKLGRGIRCHKKFLPLMYILGLDNCRVRFPYSSRIHWMTRMRAIKRTLEGLVSRRTLANSTGKRYALLVAPGDHWVHWPDRWFSNIRQPYDAAVAYKKIRRRHALHFKKRGNTVALPMEVKPGWRKENWVRWTNPLERWLQHRREYPPYDPTKHDRAPTS